MILFVAHLAHAQVAPECEAIADKPPPEWYIDDQHQNDYLLNFFSLATTFSPLHAPVPLDPGQGSLSLEVSYIPALDCDRRLVLNRSKTEDTNKAPMVPRPRVTVTFPKIGPVIAYAGLGYVPPVTVFNTRNVIISGEVGGGVPLDNGLEFGVRYHFTMIKTIAEIATPFVDGDPAVDDFYSGSTFGPDVLIGYRIKDAVTPYISGGFTDVSTFFYIGDDGIISNNLSPYAGFTGSAGAQVRWKHVDAAAEFYTAPGYLYTGRARVGWIFK